MNRFGVEAMGAVGLVLAGALSLGCSGGGTGGTGGGGGGGSDCSADQKVAGVCAGLPAQSLCASDPCTEGVTCKKVVSVSSDAELTSALKGASAGTCVALAPGKYKIAKVPGGVSLLGKSAAEVHLDQVTLTGGSGSTIRGLEIGSGGLDLGGATGFVVDAVHVTAAAGDGIRVGPGGAGEISRSAVDGSGRYGVEIVDAGDVRFDTSVVTGSVGPGLRAECTGGCSCSAGTKVEVANAAIKQSGYVGVSLVGVATTLDGVDVTDNAVGANFMPSGGVYVSECSNVTATGVRVLDNSSFGVLVDGSGGTFGKSGDATTAVEVSRNLIGIWIQNSDGHPPVSLANCALDANSGVGIGLSGAANGIIIHDSHVSNTKLVSLPALTSDGKPLGTKSVGDGLNWLGQSSAQIDGLDLSGNARASVLIDGEVGTGSSIANVTLSGGDEGKGMLQQDFPSGGVSPMIGSGAPPLKTSTVETFAIPAAPATPAAL